MRSVQLIPAMDATRLRALLDDVGQRAGAEWFGVAGRQLEVTLEEHESSKGLLRALQDEGSWSTIEINALLQAGGELGRCRVEIRVSGRVEGQEEMRHLAVQLLAEGGFGFDDHSDHAWSPHEIRDGRPTGEEFRA